MNLIGHARAGLMKKDEVPTPPCSSISVFVIEKLLLLVPKLPPIPDWLLVVAKEALLMISSDDDKELLLVVPLTRISTSSSSSPTFEKVDVETWRR